MSETDAISIIETEVKKSVNAASIVVVERRFEAMSIHKAKIAVIVKEDAIKEQTLLDLYNKIKNDSLDGINIEGTSKDIKDLSFEVLHIEVEITIGD